MKVERNSSCGRINTLHAAFVVCVLTFSRGVIGEITHYFRRSLQAPIGVMKYRAGSHVAARSKRARRYVALHFWPQRHVLSTEWILSVGALSIDAGACLNFGTTGTGP
jgi:hypothetical protein